MLIIGDSLTETGIYPGELVKLFDIDIAPMRITMLGTKSGSGVYNWISTEGASGRTVNWHYSDPASNFTYTTDNLNTGTEFHFDKYLLANNYSMLNNDWVLISLGTNDVFPSVAVNDEQTTLKATDIINQLNSIIDNIQASVKGIRVGILEVIPPSFSQDAFGKSYGAHYNRFRFRRNVALLNTAYRNAFEGREKNKVFYVPVGSNLDIRNNMTTVSEDTNATNSNQVTRQDNGVHPGILGYKQMARAIYFFLKGQEQ